LSWIDNKYFTLQSNVCQALFHRPSRDGSGSNGGTMRKLLVPTSIVVVLACSALAQNGPVTGFTLTVKGAKQGALKGDDGRKPDLITRLHST
jgi:hypothetical protein